MNLTAPIAAFLPFMTNWVRLNLTDSRAQPAHVVECRAQVLLGDPFKLTAVTGAGSMPSATTWSVMVNRSDLPFVPKSGFVIDILDQDTTTPRSLTVTSVHANGTGGPVVHFECEARGGAR